MGNKPNFYVLIFLLFIGAETSFAQLVELATVPHKNFKTQVEFGSNSRTSNTNTLPFWDDFSQGMDTLAWVFEGASYSESIGINAPSLGVIILDGTDSNGKPYSRQIRDQGAGDYLTSRPFDLSTLSVAQSTSLFLSFFWQAGGRAEMPDENDRLVLQFLNRNGQWISVWEVSGGPERDPNQFSQESVQVLADFQHDAFQFRFVNFGRLSGPFDTWVLDYVYLNTGRTFNQLSYLDRALTQANELKFGDYTAVPAIFSSSLPSSTGSIKNEFYNLENRFRAMEYSVLITNTNTGASVPINLNTPFNPVPTALERRRFSSNSPSQIPAISEETDLEVKTYLTTGDKNLFVVNSGDSTFFSQVNYRVNDTVTTLIPIRDFFAYDDGRADYAAGINQRSGMLAVKYQVDQPVYIKGLTINFTNADQIDFPIDIMVWQNLDNQPVFRREELIPLKNGIDSLTYFSLDTNIQVTGEFYVGFTQFTNDFIHIGLDKNNDKGDKIFYNVNGTWAENTEVRGSLMIRPHVSLAPPFAQLENPSEIFRIYPNPVENQLNVEGKFRDIKVFDSFGREILLERESTERGEILNFRGQKSGIYVLHLLSEKGAESFRILVK
jgi:hypothetical protein